MFAGVYQYHFKDSVARLEYLLARQTKLFRTDQGIFHLADGTTDGRFADTLGLRNMKFGSVFSPVHQGHQQLIGPAQFRRSPEIAQSFFNDLEHLRKGFSLHARKPLEIRVL